MKMRTCSSRQTVGLNESNSERVLGHNSRKQLLIIINRAIPLTKQSGAECTSGGTGAFQVRREKKWDCFWSRINVKTGLHAA